MVLNAFFLANCWRCSYKVFNRIFIELNTLEQLQQLAKTGSKSHFWMLKGKKGAPAVEQ